MSTFVFRPASRRQVTLNVTPLIDVLFLLIIFFTLTSTFKRAGELELELPGSSTSTPTDDAAPTDVEVVLLNSGAILFDGNVVAQDELGSRLATARSEDSAQRMRLLAEADVPHGDVVHVLDLVRSSGFEGASIGTHREATAR